jgi:hypothetical protein
MVINGSFSNTLGWVGESVTVTVNALQ